jgi:hypothetical protein
MSTSESFCNKCRKRTTWVRGRTAETCQECRGRFPCRACTHADCREARGELVADKNGVLREPVELVDTSAP